MKIPERKIRILLLQARRPEDPAKTEEVRSFAARAGVEVDQISAHDLLGGPPSHARLLRHDALMVGGAGDFHVSKRDLPHQQRTFDFLREVVAAGYPTFASCYGFHCLVEALGGEVIHDPDNMAVGTFELTLTPAGRSDELFGQLPEVFAAQLGHKERAADELEGVYTLARSERVPVEALRIPGKPIWTTQFHPELDQATNRGRYELYLDGYAAVMSPEEREESLRSFRESPATTDLLKRFLRLVFG